MRDPLNRMTRQRGAKAAWVLIAASEYFVRAASALTASGRPGPWLTAANILDSESKISPLSVRLAPRRARESPDCWGWGLPSWSAEPIPKPRVRGLERYCLRITVQTGGWSMPGVSELGLAMRSSAGCGSATTSRHFRDAARGGPASNEPLWFAPCPRPRALGRSRACGRGQIPHLDG